MAHLSPEDYKLKYSIKYRIMTKKLVICESENTKAEVFSVSRMTMFRGYYLS